MKKVKQFLKNYPFFKGCLALVLVIFCIFVVYKIYTRPIYLQQFMDCNVDKIARLEVTNLNNGSVTVITETEGKQKLISKLQEFSIEREVYVKASSGGNYRIRVLYQNEDSIQIVMAGKNSKIGRTKCNIHYNEENRNEIRALLRQYQEK